MNTEIQQKMSAIPGEEHLVLMKDYSDIYINYKMIQLIQSLNDTDLSDISINH